MPPEIFVSYKSYLLTVWFDFSTKLRPFQPITICFLTALSSDSLIVKDNCISKYSESMWILIKNTDTGKRTQHAIKCRAIRMCLLC